jgi:hypothetical protein
VASADRRSFRRFLLTTASSRTAAQDVFFSVDRGEVGALLLADRRHNPNLISKLASAIAALSRLPMSTRSLIMIRRR